MFIISHEQVFLKKSTVDQMEVDTDNLTRQLKATEAHNGETSKGWQAFQVIFWTWLSIATLVGNGLVLACILMKKRRNSSTFKFYGSLALGDLLVGWYYKEISCNFVFNYKLRRRLDIMKHELS